MRVTNQGGSLAGFIIIGVLLTLILVGGLFGLNRYNAQKAADEIAASKEATKSEPKPSDTQKTEPSDPEATGRERTGSAPSGTTQPPAQTTPAPAPASTDTKADSGAATKAQLPETGPADTIGSLIALGALTFVGTHYARSRTQV